MNEFLAFIFRNSFEFWANNMFHLRKIKDQVSSLEFSLSYLLSNCVFRFHYLLFTTKKKDLSFCVSIKSNKLFTVF